MDADRLEKTKQKHTAPNLACDALKPCEDCPRGTSSEILIFTSYGTSNHGISVIIIMRLAELTRCSGVLATQKRETVVIESLE